MTTSVWPDAKASVVLLPSGEQGEALFALAGEWTRMGLLSPALWVMPENVRRARTGPPRIAASVLILDRDHRLTSVELDLFEALAADPVQLVRLVKVRSAAPSRELDALQDEVADHVREYLAKSMPMAVPTASIVDQATDLAQVTLICAPTEFQLQQRVDWAASEYGTVVVASPEDRSSPWSGDAFVRDNERFVGFALMHLAGVAGLWNGVGLGTFELFPREASGMQSVWVSRVFLSAIVTEALGRRTAAQVLQDAARADSLLIDPSTGAPPEGTAFIDDEDVPAYVDRMVSSAMALDDGALSFHPIGDERAPGRERIGMGAQLGRFARFGADKLAAMPRWAWRWVGSRTARTLTRRLQGDEGTHIVGVDYDAVLDARDAGLISRRDEIFAAERETRAALAAPAGVAAQRTTPRLWSRLRELVFGALDGSADLAELGFEPIEGAVPVFGRVTDVFPSPDETWSTDDGPADLPDPVDWYALARSDPRGRLVEWSAEVRAAETDAEAALSLANQEIAVLEHRRAVGQWQAVVEGPVTAAGPAGAAAPTGGTAHRVPDAGTAEVGELSAPSPHPATVSVPEAAAPAPPVEAEPGDPDPETDHHAPESGASAEASPQTRAEAKALEEARAGDSGVALAPDAATTEVGSPDATPDATADATADATPDVKASAVPSAAPSSAAAPEPVPRPAAAPPPLDAQLASLWPAALARRAAAQDARDRARAEQRRRDAVVADYDGWSISRDRSFAWRLLARLAADRAAASDAAARFAAAIDDLTIPVAGDLLRLRRAFHRGMLIGWGAVAAVAALLILIPVWFPLVRPTDAADRSWYPENWQIVVAAVVVGILITLVLLAAYHRGWSRFERRVALAHAHLAYVSEGSRQARRELARLSSLHRQTVDWLVLLARAIHVPWRVRPEWLTKPDYDVAREAMPFAMRVGAVIEADHAASTRLRRLTAERLVVKGWRHAAFLDLVREVGAELGQDATAFGVATLDEDLPHSSNHTRQMLRDTMTREAVQTRVAAPRLRRLMAEIQRSALHGSKPRVRPIGDDPLRALAAMTDPTAADDDVAWDDFLLGSLVGRREPVTPLSATWLPARQVQEGHHEAVRSYLVLPERLERQLDFRSDAPLTTIPSAAAGKAPVDLVWRVDVAGPLPLHAIGLWDAPSEPAASESAVSGRPAADTGV